MARRAPSNVDKKTSVPDDDSEILELKRRVRELEEAVDTLRGQLIRGENPKRVSVEGMELASQTLAVKYIPSTSDGWLLVMMSGRKTSFPSGLATSITSQSSGREYGVVSEGVYIGAEFDVKAGNLVGNFERISNLEVQFVRAGKPVVVDGIKYEHQLNLSYSKDGSSKTLGPFPAKTDPDNPVPTGLHDVEIADYPHDLGSGYGAYGTVWFRIGHTGDRYIHPGRISAGCITCAPNNWESIYKVLNVARTGDGKSIGKVHVV